MHTTDRQPTPEERFHEVAAIFAAGLLRLHVRPQLAGPADPPVKFAEPGEPAVPVEPPESSRNSLPFREELRTDGLNG